jgi:hypothetical protein
MEKLPGDVQLDGGFSITGSSKDFPTRHDLQTEFGTTHPVIEHVPAAMLHSNSTVSPNRIEKLD